MKYTRLAGLPCRELANYLAVRVLSETYFMFCDVYSFPHGVSVVLIPGPEVIKLFHAQLS